ncbi:MAG: hypothetical protein RMI79_07000 [Nitrososphaerota archaeon]|nr:hypothetical protein [Nitrososphaerota archaeon]
MGTIRYLDERGKEQVESLENFTKRYGCGFNAPELRSKGVKVLSVKLRIDEETKERIKVRAEAEARFMKRLDELGERISNIRVSLEKSGLDSSLLDEEVSRVVFRLYDRILRGDISLPIIRSDNLDSGRIDAIGAVKTLRQIFEMRNAAGSGVEKVEKALALVVEQVEDIVADFEGRLKAR